MPAALLLVDVQRNMLEGEGAVPAAAGVRAVLRDLLDSARRSGVPVVHVQNDGGAEDPDYPHTVGWELVFEPLATEEVVRKGVCDTFAADPTLAGRLRAAGVDGVVVAGMQSEFCVQETALGGRREGFSVVLPREGHATYDASSRDAASVAADVDRHLEDSGVAVLPLSQVDFRG